VQEIDGRAGRDEIACMVEVRENLLLQRFDGGPDHGNPSASNRNGEYS
jgi:hypothetical protein